jgi:hypothetical protein
MRMEWAQMADRHSAAARAELDALRLQLAAVSANIGGIPSADAQRIADGPAFVHASSDLRISMQSVNAQVVELFAGSAVSTAPAQVQDSLLRLQSALPLSEASRMNSFASHLAASNPGRLNDVGEMHTR